MHVQNVHTMDELKMTGNCLKGSRGILSFDEAFDATESGRLIKEVFTHVCFSRLIAAPSPYTIRYSAYLQAPAAQNLS
jgi:Brix domain